MVRLRREGFGDGGFSVGLGWSWLFLALDGGVGGVSMEWRDDF